MDGKKENEQKINPIEKANIFSYLTFSYVLPIFKHVFRHGLKEDDLYRPLQEHESDFLGQRLERAWNKENAKNAKWALHKALLRVFGAKFMALSALKLVDDLIMMTALPWTVGRLTSYFEKGQTHMPKEEAYLAAGAIFLILVLDTFLGHHSLVQTIHIGMKVKVGCGSLMYRKALRIGKTALGSRATTIGRLVNLLSNDLSKFDSGVVLSQVLWLGPIQTAVGVYFMYEQIGAAAFFGIGFMLAFIPLQFWMGKRTSTLRLKTALRTDERVGLMNEIISGVQVIKMYCWERPFAKLISMARCKEMNPIRSHAYLIGLCFSFDLFMTRTALFLSALAYVLMGNQIRAEKIFTITAIFHQIRPMITVLFSLSISSIAEMHISVKRIQDFLSIEERQRSQSDREQLNNINSSNMTCKQNGFIKDDEPSSEPKIRLRGVNAKWLKDAMDLTLEDISLDVENGQLVAIVGPVGSGKSSLLNILLGELSVLTGQLQIEGRISYSSQEPWLFSGSVRQNILFGSEFDQELYEQVVDVCALRSDFHLLPFGDRTLVGERGSILSGGQKARINLARCIYKKADIYLLDDPLSAVDANVGKHLYEKCIEGFLRGKMCVLVTHQLQYLKSADQIVIMKDGHVEIRGSYSDLENSGLDFANLLKKFSSNEEETKTGKKVALLQHSVAEDVEVEVEPVEEGEYLKSGGIKCSVYMKYFRSGGGILMILLLFSSFILGQFFGSASDYFVSYWVNLEEKRQMNSTDYNETLSREEVIYIYSGITISTIVFAVSRSLYFMAFFVFASINMHDRTFAKIIRATMKFFHHNPSGRILNRFSKDLGHIDEYIPTVLYDVLEIALQLTGTMMLTWWIEPWLIIPSFVTLLLCYYWRKVYLHTSRGVTRIAKINLSPIFSHMTASMQGLSTIRAFGAEDLLTTEFDNIQNRYTSAAYMTIIATRCFGFWIDGMLIVLISIANFIILYFNKELYGGDMGLIITQYIALISCLQWALRQWSELENQMVSVERVLEYQQIDEEPSREPLINIPKDWPELGKIEFRDVVLQYNSEEAPVLKKLNFTVMPREKVGIVGRTGAGKSSLITALFQLYPISGTIWVDDVDITRMPLEQARSKISIIPQEPVLFLGSMRKNLDPFDQYSDEVLWAALEQVELKEVVADLPHGLNANVSEGGTNFSVGQRQLVCLARALIRDNRILVLDEATANVDPHTDALIQKTIRKQFAACTVLTIAHRLHTVMDSDKILVMSDGRVVEFDRPYELLKNPESILYNLVQKTGRQTALNLENIARSNHKNE